MRPSVGPVPASPMELAQVTVAVDSSVVIRRKYLNPKSMLNNMAFWAIFNWFGLICYVLLRSG